MSTTPNPQAGHWYPPPPPPPYRPPAPPAYRPPAPPARLSRGGLVVLFVIGISVLLPVVLISAAAVAGAILVPVEPDTEQAETVRPNKDGAVTAPKPKAVPAPQPPPPAQEVIAATSPSIVKITAMGCWGPGKWAFGTGWVQDADTVVTAAHVVAGHTDLTVLRDDGVELPASILRFDVDRDLAVLSVPGLERPALPLGDAQADSIGWLFGHPGGEPLRIANVAIMGVSPYELPDVYDGEGITSPIVFVWGDIRGGDSGGPVVDRYGRVVGVELRGGVDHAANSAIATSELATVLAQRPATDTGACLPFHG